MPADRAASWMPALIVLLVVATVFNDLHPLLPVGEMANDGFVYAVPLALLYFLRRPGRIAVPRVFFALTLAFLLVIVLGVASNFAEISTAWYKERSGMSRVITQAMAVAMGPVVTLMFFNFAVRGGLPAISRGAWIALLVMAGVAVFEVASWVGLPGLSHVHQALSLVIHADTSGYYATRLRMTAFEASWAAVMLTFIFPFALTGGSPRRVALVAGIVVVLMLLLQSRTAMLVVAVQFMLLLLGFFRHRKDLIVHAATAAALVLLTTMMIPSVQSSVMEKGSNLIRYGSMDGLIDPTPGVTENVSNITRMAAIRAGLSMAEERPLLGVGLGQYGFNYPYHIRAEDLRSWEVRRYATAADTGLTWPPAYSLHVRLLAETGLLGYLLWLAMIVPLLLRSLARASGASPAGRLHLAVAMTLTGWLMLGASIDSFRFFGGWIALGVGLALWRTPRQKAGA
ncbi:O-antigen ligase family protein [Paracoccus sp. Z118]|uniref:O-antigen ligase family protein n=1 Tax=Paracoccus sp. Z118 TaxID=2851017 RepID=UPI001C2B8B9B|nr:O-antigen ligase family protein [Paracoccus sp. Z118]MBV0892982.1 O-antigen ligase family protein [Paracoccus sp. Z118]